uniref:Uncharacterized protein n=1 Tax=Vespula pensylvanica TaxID=30213 RepID=A0A834P8M0_VESPE|nr:hypothetical protein H0235_005085 [Vespula pensylvanica]
MVQPVHTENNNSALDMESLEEMLRKKVNREVGIVGVLPRLIGVGFGIRRATKSFADCRLQIQSNVNAAARLIGLFNL